MITALVFAIISLGLVGLVTVDCQAHLRNADDENPPQDRVRRD